MNGMFSPSGASVEDRLNNLVAVSREYGSDPKWVVAGGGNTSFKDDRTLYVKASGFPLATIGSDGFARMDRGKLAAIWNRDYPAGDDSQSVAERERLVLADVMAARIPGEVRRPSVETLLHDILPWPLVVHLHPTLVNGLTCGKSGTGIAARLFGDSHVWIPYVDPGYVLAKAIRDALDIRTKQGQDTPDFIFLANHGVFAGGRDEREIHEKYSRLESRLSEKLVREPGSMPTKTLFPTDTVELESAVEEIFGSIAKLKYVKGGELNRFLATADDATALTGSLTPDHIVYAGPGAMYLGPVEFGRASAADAWLQNAGRYYEVWGKKPNIALLNDGGNIHGALITADSDKSLTNAEILLNNALEVCAYAESFGGPRLMNEKQVRFIVNWEAESYRKEQL